MPFSFELNRREWQTIVAALRYWRDEMAPYPEIQGPYLEDPQMQSLSVDEIDELCRKLLSEPSGDCPKSS